MKLPKKRGNRRPVLEKKAQFRRFIILPVLACLLCLSLIPAQAQEADPIPVERLQITGTSAESLPSIEVRLYGRDAQGNALDLSREALDIMHGDSPVGLINYQGAHRTGTLTIFLIDIPTGVEGQLPALEEAIGQYASPGNMMEQVDSVAVYQVGATEARELLPPTNFHNTVRNLFAEPLNPETGATALYDSTVNLLDRVESITPNAEMPVQIVVMTDGTDVVSVGNTGDGVIRRAAELGIPIHTVWLENADLSTTFGQEYLTTLAAGTGGVAAALNNPAELPLIWNRIGSFRDQARIRYEVNGLTGGNFPVTVSLLDMPWITTDTAVDIPFNIPSILIDLAPESRILTLPDLAEPVRLRFKTETSWLDGEERTIDAANLIINEDTAAPFAIPVESLDEFVADVGNLNYGNNTVEISVIDSQGLRATSPTIVLTVEEGRTAIPAELNGGNQLGQLFGQLFTILIVAVLVVAFFFLLYRQGYLSRLSDVRIGGGSRRRSRRRGGPSITIEDEPAAVNAPVQSGTTVVMGYLDVLESVTRMEPTMPLQGTLVRIGRSPAQCEIAFENDITVSRLHANLQLEGNDYRIFDEKSTSGTFVNERQVPEYGIQLMDGDEIHLGAVHLRYRRAG